MKIFFCLLFSTLVAFGLEITVEKIYPRNMLQNAEVKVLPNGLPETWHFDNCTQASYMIGSATSGVLCVEAGRKNSAYFYQYVKVEEDVKYYSEVQARSSGPNVLIWIKTNQFDDKKNPQHHPFSQTEIFHEGKSAFGDEFLEELSMFVNPKLLRTLSASKWSTIRGEFVSMPGQNVDTYRWAVGAYFGPPGKVFCRNMYFAPAAWVLRVAVKGKGAKNLILHHSSNLERRELDPETELQTVEFKLASRMIPLRLELIDHNGNIQHREP